jgi:disulfide bond formation protein DsbB
MKDDQSTTGWFPSRRLVNGLGFLACVLAMACAYFFFQGYLGLEPCPLCIFQRVTMMALGLIFLVAALHNPQRWGVRIYGTLIALTAATGAAIAARHVWLQSLSPDQVPSCGPGLDYMLENLPLKQTIRLVLTGSGDCAEIQWSFLGLSIPGWTLVVFVVLGLMGTVRNWMHR